MQTFICEFDDEGVIRRSTVEAGDAEEAVRRLRNMDLDVRRIGTSNENLEPIPRADDPVPPAPQRPVTISIEAEEDEGNDPEHDGSYENPLAVPHPTINPVPVVPPPPPTMGDSRQFNSIIEDDIPSDDPEPPKEKTHFVDVRRRHSLLFGTHEEIRERLNNLLSHAYGKVAHFAMNPDMKGKIILAIVVEHDEIVK